MADINDILKNMSKSDLSAAVKRAKMLAGTEEGQKLMQNMNTDQIRKEINNNPEILKIIKEMLG